MTNAPNRWKWWSTVKTAVFGASSLPSLVDKKGRLDLSPDEKPHYSGGTLMLNSTEIVFNNIILGALSPVLYSVAFLFCFLRRLLLNLDSYNGIDADGIFSLFYKQVDEKLPLKLALILRHLVKGGIFPVSRRLVYVVLLPLESSYSNDADCRPFSITPVLSKVFEILWL